MERRATGFWNHSGLAARLRRRAAGDAGNHRLFADLGIADLHSAVAVQDLQSEAPAVVCVLLHLGFPRCAAAGAGVHDVFRHSAGAAGSFYRLSGRYAGLRHELRRVHFRKPEGRHQRHRPWPVRSRHGAGRSLSLHDEGCDPAPGHQERAAQSGERIYQSFEEYYPDCLHRSGGYPQRGPADPGPDVPGVRTVFCHCGVLLCSGVGPVLPWKGAGKEGERK